MTRPLRPAGCEHRRLSSSSAATTKSAWASGSSSASHADVPVRSWNCPGRRRAASLSGNPASSSSPVRFGSTVVRSNWIPARRARSAARAASRRRARSARSSLVCPATRATRTPRSAGRSPGRPLRTSRSSTTAATMHARVDGTAATMRASRGCSGRVTIMRPIAVSESSSARAPSIRSRLRPSFQARAGGGSGKARCSTGVPHSATSSARPDRSTDAISAERCAGRVPCSIFDHSR